MILFLAIHSKRDCVRVTIEGAEQQEYEVAIVLWATICHSFQTVQNVNRELCKTPEQQPLTTRIELKMLVS